MLRKLLDRPEVEKLERFLRDLLKRRRDEIEFVILFGSMARGDWPVGSDYDVLIGLSYDDGKRFIDRLEDFSPWEGNIEVFPYSLCEWQRMFAEYHPLLLEVLAHSIVLWDRGAFSRMRKTFKEWLQSGKVTPWHNGWKIKDTC